MMPYIYVNIKYIVYKNMFKRYEIWENSNKRSNLVNEIMKLENQIQALGEREYQRQIEPEVARKKERQKAKVAQPPKDTKDGFVFHANPAGSSSDKLSLRFLVKDWIII